jgi:hypothetical protein
MWVAGDPCGLLNHPPCWYHAPLSVSGAAARSRRPPVLSPALSPVLSPPHLLSLSSYCRPPPLVARRVDHHPRLVNSLTAMASREMPLLLASLVRIITTKSLSLL